MLDIVTTFALIGIVLTVSALASPYVRRAPISFLILFLTLGSSASTASTASLSTLTTASSRLPRPSR